MSRTFRTPSKLITLSESGVGKRIQLLRTGQFTHDQYGKFEITKAHLVLMEVNFKKKVRGIDLAVDYKHDRDNIAAGWILSLSLENNGTELWADVDWTPNGVKVLAEKEFRYVSPEFTFDYQNNETLEKFGPVLLGAGLTNRPTIKNMEPVVELSEMYAEKPKPKPAQAKGTKSMDFSTVDPASLDTMSPEDMKTLCQQMLDYIKKDMAADAAGGDEADLAEKAMAEVKKKADDAQKSAAVATKKLSEVMAQLALSEKKQQFVKLLSEGKACKAQEAAFLAGDTVKFAEAASNKALNLSERGTGGENSTPANIETAEQAEAEVIRLSEVMVNEKKAVSLSEAQRMVLKSHPELQAKIYS